MGHTDFILVINAFEAKKKRFSAYIMQLLFLILHYRRGSSSVGRASASQAEGRGFEPRFPLNSENWIFN